MSVPDEECAAGQHSGPGLLEGVGAKPIGRGDAGDPVVRREAPVQEGLLGGEELPEGAVGLEDEVLDELEGLLDHELPELRVPARLGGARRLFEHLELEPLGEEVAHAAPGPGVVHHPLGLGAEHEGVRELSPLGGGEEGLVGQRSPDGVGEAARHREGVRRRVPTVHRARDDDALFRPRADSVGLRHQVYEFGESQHRRQGDLRPSIRRARSPPRLDEQGGQLLGEGRVRRATEDGEGPARDEARGAVPKVPVVFRAAGLLQGPGRGTGGDHLHQPPVCFDEGSARREPIDVIVEAARPRVLGEARRGHSHPGEQVPEGVPELHRAQPAQRVGGGPAGAGGAGAPKGLGVGVFEGAPGPRATDLPGASGEGGHGGERPDQEGPRPKAGPALRGGGGGPCKCHHALSVPRRSEYGSGEAPPRPPRVGHRAAQRGELARRRSGGRAVIAGDVEAVGARAARVRLGPRVRGAAGDGGRRGAGPHRRGRRRVGPC